MLKFNCTNVNIVAFASNLKNLGDIWIYTGHSQSRCNDITIKLIHISTDCALKTVPCGEEVQLGVGIRLPRTKVGRVRVPVWIVERTSCKICGESCGKTCNHKNNNNKPLMGGFL